MLPLFRHKEHIIVCGCDEAGRGCLAGPVVAAAAVLPDDFSHPLLNDSKQLSRLHREELRAFIAENALCYAIGVVDNTTIDRINILQASILAMHRAIAQLPALPGYIVVDGNKFKPFAEIPYECVVKGDGKYSQIAAASILAKTERDDIMQKMHQDFPAYNWAGNKGYPSQDHRQAIRIHGTTPFHRMSYNLLGTRQLKLF